MISIYRKYNLEMMILLLCRISTSFVSNLANYSNILPSVSITTQFSISSLSQIYHPAGSLMNELCKF